MANPSNEQANTEQAAEIKMNTEDSDSNLAKAGKRSAKAQAAAKATAEKEAKKESAASNQPASSSKKAKPPRSRVERAGRKFRQAAEKVDPAKRYELREAVEIALNTSPVSFDAALELHINLNVDPKQADQNIRGTVVLPSGSGKDIKVAVVTTDKLAAAAKKAGADQVGAEQIFENLDKEQINFDVLIATPDMMPKLGKYARLLGPKGLMPSPKSGTVTSNPAQAVAEAKAGKVEFRVDSYGIIHLSVGKLSFGQQKLLENTEAVITAVRSARPPSVKGNYIESIALSTSMGPSVRVQA